MREQNLRSSVRWLDGTYDAKRVCDECGLENCLYPVYKDYYKEFISKKSYWNWMEENNLKEDSDEFTTQSL